MTNHEPAAQLIAMLGQPYDPKRVQALLQPYGVKRMPVPKSTFNDDTVWCVKASLRIDVYRAPKLNLLTGLQYADTGEWIIGAIHFLAPGSDDRIKVAYPGSLLKEIVMDSEPEEAIDAYGPPQMDEECEWPGFSGRIIAWRKSGINLVIEYEDQAEGRALKSCTICLVGCIGAWTSDNPEVFAP